MPSSLNCIAAAAPPLPPGSSMIHSLPDLVSFLSSHPPETEWQLFGNFYLRAKVLASCNHTIFHAMHKRQANNAFVVKLTHQQQELDFATHMHSHAVVGGDADTHLVACFEWGPVTIAGYTCLALVMEAGARNCDDRLADLQQEPYTRLRCIDHIAKAVDFLHANGYIHGDLKLKNAVEFAGDRFKLIDFDHAMRLDHTMRELPPHCTHAYCPPELARHLRRGGPPVAASVKFDMWCLGVLVLKLFLPDGELVEFANADDEFILDLIAADGFSFERSLAVAATALAPRQRHYLALCLDPNPTTRAASVVTSLLKMVKIKTNVTDMERHVVAASLRTHAHHQCHGRRRRRGMSKDKQFLAAVGALVDGETRSLWAEFELVATPVGGTRTMFEARWPSRSTSSSYVVKLTQHQDTAFLATLVSRSTTSPLVHVVKYGRVNLDDDETCLALVMERGHATLRELLPTLHMDGRRHALAAVAHAVQWLHDETAYLHGDISLDNVMAFRSTSDDDVFKLVDLSHVVKLGDEVPPFASLPYCPPEMARYVLHVTDCVHAASTFDVWCLAVLVLQLFSPECGLVEFQGLADDDVAALALLATDTFNFDLSVDASYLNVAQKALLRQCLEPDVTKRATTVAPLLELLAIQNVHDTTSTLPLLWTLGVATDKKVLPGGDRLRRLTCHVGMIALDTSLTMHDVVSVQADADVVASLLPFLKALQLFVLALHVLVDEYDVALVDAVHVAIASAPVDVETLGKTIAALQTIHGAPATTSFETTMTPLVDRLRSEELTRDQVAAVATNVHDAFRSFCADWEQTLVPAAQVLDRFTSLNDGMCWGLDDWRRRVHAASAQRHQRNFELVVTMEKAKRVLAQGVEIPTGSGPPKTTSGGVDGQKPLASLTGRSIATTPTTA
ncbi:Aste57867_78 [Aphanomyces stellatus]|uniref:Aste57867_78 protein n=1 Tax=Aphanomyces stellatus TaxID=120398 RepID=A0A485K6P1_9STRA|nr:hypothetical protein As57867_000078 [Aphanomyces stellatus]VFT77304.1 Aste57867_78 [Aphanomyces stellatus]